MTSLEFIEAKIKSTKRRIQELRKDQSFAITHNREDEFLDLDSDIEYYENLLNHLQQIKSELEAWEICKNKKVDMFDVMYSANAEVYNCCLYKDYQLTEKELETIKRALEAE